MLVELTLVAGMLLVASALVMAYSAARLRRRVSVAAWLLTRAVAAIDEAERAGRLAHRPSDASG